MMIQAMAVGLTLINRLVRCSETACPVPSGVRGEATYSGGSQCGIFGLSFEGSGGGRLHYGTMSVRSRRLEGVAEVVFAGICFGTLGLIGKRAFAAGITGGELMAFR